LYHRNRRNILIAVMILLLLTGTGIFFVFSIHSALMSNTLPENLKEQSSQIYRIIIAFVVCVIAGTLAVTCCLLKLKRKSDEDKKKAAEEIKLHAFTDTLTKLPNRSAMKQEIANWMDYCREQEHNGGAFFLDVDNFQSVNNTFGHNIGDLVLEECSARLVTLVGKDDKIGRIGGDEFALLIHPIHTQDELKQFANKILDIFTKPFLVHGIIVQMNCSIGTMLFNWTEEKAQKDYDKIINQTEFVLSQAKNTNKGGYCIFDNLIGEQEDRQVKMQHSLKKAIANNEMLVYFQAQYDIQEKKIIGFEALVRWDSKQFGMVSPVQFIPLAEKTGYIKEVGRFVIDKTFAFAKEYENTDFCISFNCSAIELLQADFIDYIKERFDYYNLRWHSVAIEITESCLIESFDEVTQKLNDLCDYGLLVYLDDFGTGYSSLTYLKNLPIDAVKIDKSFIDEISTNTTEKDIVGMIVGLAGKLHLRVIAEGVEIENQLDDLQQCGCTVIQGFYISRPIPQNEVPRLLVAHA